jgi:hypothetical protein
MSGKFRQAAIQFREAFERASTVNVKPSVFECKFCGAPWMGSLGQAPHTEKCVSHYAYHLLNEALEEEAKLIEAYTMASQI